MGKTMSFLKFLESLLLYIFYPKNKAQEFGAEKLDTLKVELVQEIEKLGIDLPIDIKKIEISPEKLLQFQ